MKKGKALGIDKISEEVWKYKDEYLKEWTREIRSRRWIESDVWKVKRWWRSEKKWKRVRRYNERRWRSSGGMQEADEVEE